MGLYEEKSHSFINFTLYYFKPDIPFALIAIHICTYIMTSHIIQHKTADSAAEYSLFLTVIHIHIFCPSLDTQVTYCRADLKVNTNLRYSESCRMTDQSHPFRSRHLTHGNRYRLSTLRHTENVQRWYSEFRFRDCSSEHLFRTLTTIRLEPLLKSFPCFCLSATLACWCWYV
jgi:hypothetical protein